MIRVYIGIALIAASFFGGWQVHSWYQESGDLKATQEAVAKAVKKARAEDKIKHDAALALVESQKKTKTVFKTVTKEVTKYVTKNIIAQRECLDHTGLMLWNTASAGTDIEGKTTSGIDPTMPRFITSIEGVEWWRTAGKPYRSGGDISRLQKPTQRFDQTTSGD